MTRAGGAGVVTAVDFVAGAVHFSGDTAELAGVASADANVGGTVVIKFGG